MKIKSHDHIYHTLYFCCTQFNLFLVKVETINLLHECEEVRACAVMHNQQLFGMFNLFSTLCLWILGIASKVSS